MSNSPPNRKRNKTLTIRLTPEEWTKLMEGTLHAGMNVTEYLLSLSDSAQIFPPPDLSPLLVQLKRIGNNLNQIAAKALLDQSAAHGDYAGFAAGLDAVAAVAELFEDDSDDPEEQRSRMESRQAAENVGTLLALAILLTERVIRYKDSQAEAEEETFHQKEHLPFSHEEEQDQAEAELDEPDWKEGDALTFEW